MNEESIVGRTEIEEQPEKAACYQDILAQSKRSSEKNQAMLSKVRIKLFNMLVMCIMKAL